MSRRAQRKAETAEKLLSVARVAFERDGYEAVTFRGLAKEAGMSTGAYFASWPDKGALFKAATGQSADIGDFLNRVAVCCAGYPGALGELAEDALKLRQVFVGRGR